MRPIEFFNEIAEIAENMTESRRPGNYYREPNQSENIPLGEIDFDSLYSAPVINGPTFFASRDSVPPDAPIGTMYFDRSTDSMMVMTESGFVRIEGVDNFEESVGIPVDNYELWYPPAGCCRNILQPFNIRKKRPYEDLDELYVANEVQKSKKTRLFIFKRCRQYRN